MTTRVEPYICAGCGEVSTKEICCRIEECFSCGAHCANTIYSHTFDERVCCGCRRFQEELYFGIWDACGLCQGQRTGKQEGYGDERADV